jgi:hypothetical protein
MKLAFNHPTGPMLASNGVGIGLKTEHADDVLSGAHSIDFFEVHAENYMGDGGPPHHMLGEVRARYPLSLHGVGLSIGSACGIDRVHLSRLRRLVDRYRPRLFSSISHGRPMTGGFSATSCRCPTIPRPWRASASTSTKCRTAWACMLLEALDLCRVRNLRHERGRVSGAVAARTGWPLLDVNNVVAATNHGFEPMAYIDAFPLDRVGEIHLAGFAEDRDDENARLLIDAPARRSPTPCGRSTGGPSRAADR